MSDTLLEIRHLNIEFHDHDKPESVVNDFNLTLQQGEIVGIVGESGSGKSMTAMAIAGLLRRHDMKKSGEILFEGTELLHAKRSLLRQYQGNDISMVFQEPMTSLNPVKRIGWQVEESLRLHRPEMTKQERYERAIESLRNVELDQPEKVYKQYPHELSGGMRQRVMIASAMICEPRLLIADEPTTALDVTIQAQIISLMKELQKKMGMSIVLITHDLGVVADIADEIVVMYAGKIVEKGKCRDIFYRRRHPYTWALLKSVPRVDYEKKQPLVTIEGGIPDMTNPPKGCAFCQRCPYAMNICSEYEPTKTTLADGHEVWCWLLDKRADLSKVPEEIRRRKDE